MSFREMSRADFPPRVQSENELSEVSSRSHEEPVGTLKLRLPLVPIPSANSLHEQQTPFAPDDVDGGQQRPNPQVCRRDYNGIFNEMSGRSKGTKQLRGQSSRPPRLTVEVLMAHNRDISVKSSPAKLLSDQLSSLYSQRSSVVSLAIKGNSREPSPFPFGKTSVMSSLHFGGKTPSMCSNDCHSTSPDEQSSKHSQHGRSRPATTSFRVAQFNENTETFERVVEGSEHSSSVNQWQESEIYDEEFWTLRDQKVQRLRRKAEVTKGKAALATGVGAGTITGVSVGVSALAIKAAVTGAALGSAFPIIGTAVGGVVGLAIGVAFIFYGTRQWSKHRQEEQTATATQGETATVPPSLLRQPSFELWKTETEDNSAQDHVTPKGEQPSEIEMHELPKLNLRNERSNRSTTDSFNEGAEDSNDAKEGLNLVNLNMDSGTDTIPTVDVEDDRES